MASEESINTYLVPSNKFYPPHIDHSQSLLRSALLTTKLPSPRQNKKAVIIEAQAGQGKTTLAYQFLIHNNYTYIWYQIGPEDSDPILLLSSLLNNFCTTLHGFTSPQLTSILEEGSVGPLDLTRCANILLNDLDNYLTEDIYLVFDDLHLIEFGTLTNRLIEHLLDTSPPSVHFLFISRHPVEFKGKTIRNGARISYLNTADLALTTNEIERLYQTVFKKDISKQDAISIQKITNGWVMGIILTSHPISGRPGFWRENSKTRITTHPQSGHMLDYFQDEIFDRIPEYLHIPFLQLSFLQEIPTDLATKITGIVDFRKILIEMTRENAFIYNLDDQHHTFRFHHFFQEFLQQRAKNILSEGDIANVYQEEARYCLEKDLTEKALTCYKNAGDFAKMARTLQEKGMQLIARNKTFSILTLLQTIPDDILLQYSWLTLYAGLLRIDYAPQTTLPFFNNARKQFNRSGEEVGELIALSQTIYFHFVISGNYVEGSGLLSRTRTLLEKNKTDLPMSIIVMTARNLASGYCFFNSDMEKARHYINMANKLANRHNIKNFIASTRFIQGYIELLSGNRAKYLREAEVCFSLFNDPVVGESNRLTINVMNLCYLSMIGEHENFRRQQLTTQKSIAKAIVDQTVAAPYLFVWGSSNLFSSGQTKQALDLLHRGLNVTSTASSNHMHSQLLQWQAFGLSLSGKHDKCLEKITEATMLREKAGGPFYISFHNIIAGAVYTRAQQYDKANTALGKGLSIARAIPSTYLTIAALFNLCYLHYETGGADAALEDLEAGLSLMKINGYNHFWTWEPVMMQTLLTVAIKRDIEKNFVQVLARKRLDLNISDDGRNIPLLHFTLLDNFKLSIQGNVILRAKDLTPFQRELLGLLITAKGQRIPQEKIQLELWPESSPDNARKSFDTLLTRVRKLIAPHLPLPVKNYLSLQKGILCLTNYHIDAMEFLEIARTGLAHNKNSDWWQAYNSFQTALSLWKGAMPEDTFRSEQVLSFNDMLAGILSDVAATWSRHMAETGRIDDAVTLLERVLRINYLDEELTIALYRLHSKNHKPLKAKEILDRYHKALLKAEYTPEETAEFIENIINRP